MDSARKPRQLSERLRWKATELRQFLLYTGPVILHDVLSEPVYNNFMLLSVAIFILSSPTLCIGLNDFAHSLLVSFVKHFSELYGPQFVSYNVHGLTHLSEDVKKHERLDLISGFPFVNFLGQIKKIRPPHHPLSQIIRRLSEMDSSLVNANVRTELKKQHENGPIPPGFNDTHQFQEVVVVSTRLNLLSMGDSCVKIGGCVGLVMNILQCQEKVYMIYKEYEHMEPFFHYPINSIQIRIYLVDNLSPSLKYVELNENVMKSVRLPYHGRFVAVPVLHTE